MFSLKVFWCCLPKIIMPPPHRTDALSDDARLTSVCLSRTSSLSWEQRGLWRLNGTEVPTSHVTRTPLSRSKGRRSSCRGRGVLWRPPAQLVKKISLCLSRFWGNVSLQAQSRREGLIICEMRSRPCKPGVWVRHSLWRTQTPGFDSEGPS